MVIAWAVGSSLWHFRSVEERTIRGGCARLLIERKIENVDVSGCQIDFDRVIAQTTAGFEWVQTREVIDTEVSVDTMAASTMALYAPIVVESLSSGSVTIYYRLVDGDVLTWIDNYRRGDRSWKKAMIERREVIDRLARPGAIRAHVDRTGVAAEILQFVGPASARLAIVLVPGIRFDLDALWPQVLLGISGLLVVFWAMRRGAT